MEAFKSKVWVEKLGVDVLGVSVLLLDDLALMDDWAPCTETNLFPVLESA